MWSTETDTVPLTRNSSHHNQTEGSSFSTKLEDDGVIHQNFWGGTGGRDIEINNYLEEQAYMDNQFGTPSREPQLSRTQCQSRDRLCYTKDLFGRNRGASDSGFSSQSSPDSRHSFTRENNPKMNDSLFDSILNTHEYSVGSREQLLHDIMNSGVGEQPCLQDHLQNMTIGSSKSSQPSSQGSVDSHADILLSTLSASRSQEGLVSDKHYFPQQILAHGVPGNSAGLSHKDPHGQREQFLEMNRISADRMNDREREVVGMQQAIGNNFMQPIRVITQSNTQNNSHQGIQPWSTPSTPNSASDGTPTSSYENPLHPASRSSYPKNIQQKFTSSTTQHHSPVPTGHIDSRTGFQPGNIRNHSTSGLFLPRQRHTSEARPELNKLGERNPHASISAPDQISLDRSNLLLKDMQYHQSRPHNPYEDYFSTDFAQIPTAIHGNQMPKFAPTLPPHVGPDSYEFFNPYEPYLQGKLPAAPAFFGPNEVFFDFPPPTPFYGIPPFFQGFRPPRFVLLRFILNQLRFLLKFEESVRMGGFFSYCTHTCPNVPFGV